MAKEPIQWELMHPGGEYHGSVTKYEARKQDNGNIVGIFHLRDRMRYHQAENFVKNELKINLLPIESTGKLLLPFGSDGWKTSPHYVKIRGATRRGLMYFELGFAQKATGKVKSMVENKKDAPVFQCAKRTKREEEKNEEEPEDMWHSGEEYPPSPPPRAPPTPEPYKQKAAAVSPPEKEESQLNVPIPKLLVPLPVATPLGEGAASAFPLDEVASLVTPKQPVS